MKKFILAAALAAFSFTAQAATPTGTCIDVATSLTTMSESVILDSLIAPGCGMGIQEAVAAIIAAGGDQQNTLTAALAIDPAFVLATADPTAGLDPTAAGGDTAATGATAPTLASSAPVSSGGGGPVSP